MYINDKWDTCHVYNVLIASLQKIYSSFAGIRTQVLCMTSRYPLAYHPCMIITKLQGYLPRILYFHFRYAVTSFLEVIRVHDSEFSQNPQFSSYFSYSLNTHEYRSSIFLENTQWLYLGLVLRRQVETFTLHNNQNSFLFRTIKP